MQSKFSIFPDDAQDSLEFDKIIELLQASCLSDLGKKALAETRFSYHVDEVNFILRQVSEMKDGLVNGLKFPAQNYHDLSLELKAISIINNLIEGKQFRKIMNSALTVEAIQEFFKKHPDQFSTLRKNIELISIDKNIPKAIDKVIDEEGNVRSDASPTLVKIRKEINSKSRAIQLVFGRILKNLKNESKLAETQESIRNGRRVLALHAESKRSVNGIIHDESDSGKTSYIEPQETVLLNNDLFELEREENREVFRILQTLSANISTSLTTLNNYQEILASYDLIRSKALLAMKMDAVMPILGNAGEIYYKDAYHPLLLLKNIGMKKETVPFELEIDKKQSILLISGPNAGGKSVCLKAVGLMQMMLQFGLLLPCDENSKVLLFEQIFADLGDKQSIEDELSTYSSHLFLMKNFLKRANGKTLFLIDEFGTGTDPRLGAAMAEALILRLASTTAYGVITTHYSNLKKVAEQDNRFLNAAMVFNEENLSPTYQLKTGKPGSSYTFAIAEKSGLDKDLIEEAKTYVDYSDLKFEELISKVEKERKLLEEENRNIKKENNKLKEATQRFETLNEQIHGRQQELRQQIITLEQQKNEAVEQRVNQILNEINNAKSKEVAAQKAKDFASHRKEVLAQKEGSIEASSKVSSKKLDVGDIVLIGESESEGEIIEMRGNQAIVAVRGLRTSISLKKLQKIIKQEKKVKTSKRRIANYEVESVFDIRGLMQEEAGPMIEQYFDQALYNSIDEIKIIHGKGSGALRRQLQQLIKEYKSSIASWQYEEEKKGGNGATIIRFK
ncbi:MAG: DNA mismatch repair protein MutS2 [Chitinophagales bacterium]|jgi:DNA mismatch repair protein MutS2